MSKLPLKTQILNIYIFVRIAENVMFLQPRILHTRPRALQTRIGRALEKGWNLSTIINGTSRMEFWLTDAFLWMEV